MSFASDNYWSKKMDVVLSDYWKHLAFEGRYIFTNSKMLQQTLGIDVIIQLGSNDKEITIDTKHSRGSFDAVLLEAMSCTVKGKEKEGWGIKEEGRPDYIMHVMHDLCKGCNLNCSTCEYTASHITKAFITSAEGILQWYRPLFFSKQLSSFKSFTTEQLNRTHGHIIPLRVAMKELGTTVCNLKH